jgi:hypothetical protein
MEGLKAAMVHSSRLRIARYLKANVPAHFSGVDDAFLWGTALASEKSADQLGIETERGRARWDDAVRRAGGLYQGGARLYPKRAGKPRRAGQRADETHGGAARRLGGRIAGGVLGGVIGSVFGLIGATMSQGRNRPIFPWSAHQSGLW